jgi:RNA polymerase sigma factor (TIGR02999 family)
MNGDTRARVTRLLRELEDDAAPRTQLSEEIFALVYDELHRTARAIMSRERADHTLQPTALVHEAYIRLVDAGGSGATDRAHFLGIAARCMRQILVDHARAHRAEKRGGDKQRVTLVEELITDEGRELELLLLDDALVKFAALDERAARVAEMRLFGGMTVDEIAAALEVSKRTVDGDWSTARRWLARELGNA